jgi:glycosyltransferase involved in cell wall biosynthesis
MRKVLYVIGQLHTGGTEKQLYELLKKINRQAFEPTVVCLSGERTMLVDKFVQAGVSPILLDREEKGRGLTIRRLIQLIKEIRPDIIHAFSYASRAGILAATVTGRPKIIVSLRNDPKRWLSFMDRILINSVDLIIDNSRHVVHSYQINNRGRMPASKVIVNGIDIQAFDSASRSDLAFPLPANFRSGRPVICSVMRLVSHKRIDNLLFAFSLLQETHPDVGLWIVGDGNLRRKLEELTRSLNIQDQVSFWGIRSDVASILRHATVGVQTSEYEGLPNSVIEYMTARLPVVATNVKGTNEIVVHGETGWLVPFGDHQAFANAIGNILQNPDIAQRFGQTGRRRVEEFFTVERMVRETELIYTDLLKNPQISY